MASPNVQKWMAKMQKMENVVKNDYNPFAHIVESRSPSLNFTFGRTHGLPAGYTLLMYGPSKSGKSLVINDMIGYQHQLDDDAIAIKFDTEVRSELQTPTEADEGNNIFGIDPKRVITFKTNHPKDIFDFIERDVPAMCQEGVPVKIIAIDSINGIQGRRGTGNDSIMDMTIGDQALTLQEGFKRILPVQRKYNIAMICSAQVRAEMDPQAARYSKYRMGAANATMHYAEYHALVEKVNSKESKSDDLGNVMEDEPRKDMSGHTQSTGHRIRFTMKGNSADGGCIGRTAEFTIDYKKGMSFKEQEVFALGIAQGVIAKPTLQSYSFKDKSWRGYSAALEAIKNDNALYNEILKEIKAKDYP